MITELSVQNYRSLKDTKLALGPLTVLIGANGSGKSNILNVLSLLQLLTVNDSTQSDRVFTEIGGFNEVVWGGETDHGIAVEISWQPERLQTDSQQQHTVQFVQDERNTAVFSAERFAAPGEPVLVRGPSDFSHRTARGSVSRVRSVVPTVGIENLSSPNLMESMREWAFYHFNPALMRQPQPVKKEYRLAETGQNLSTVVHTLFSDGAPALDETVDILRACVPTVEGLSSPIYGDAQTYVALKERWVPMPVGSWGLSDGTLLALALATALMTPKPPSLLALEAPDIELHPHVMETLAGMLTVAAERTQVITTTHSPYLLDFLPPESFVVVDKVKGATRCTPLKGRKGIAKLMRELGASRAWHAGHIGGVP